MQKLTNDSLRVKFPYLERKRIGDTDVILTEHALNQGYVEGDDVFYVIADGPLNTVYYESFDNLQTAKMVFNRLCQLMKG